MTFPHHCHWSMIRVECSVTDAQTSSKLIRKVFASVCLSAKHEYPLPRCHGWMAESLGLEECWEMTVCVNWPAVCDMTCHTPNNREQQRNYRETASGTAPLHKIIAQLSHLHLQRRIVLAMASCDSQLSIAHVFTHWRDMERAEQRCNSRLIWWWTTDCDDGVRRQGEKDRWQARWLWKKKLYTDAIGSDDRRLYCDQRAEDRAIPVPRWLICCDTWHP